MKVSKLENFVMAGLTLLGLGDALFLIFGKGAFGGLADAAE